MKLVPSTIRTGGSETRPDAATLVVLDPDTKEHLTFTDAQVYEAEELDRNLRRSVFEIAFSLKRILDERLYLALGFESKQDYIVQRLPFGKVQAYSYKGIGDAFAPLLLESGDSGNVQRLNADGLSDLGVQKLDLLRQMDRERLARLVREGVLDLGDGETVTLDEVKTDSVKQLGERVRRYRARVSELEERLKLAESETAASAELHADMEAREAEAQRKLEQAQDLERLYSSRALTYEQQGRALDAADTALADLRRNLIRCGVDPTSAETHHRRVATLLRELDALRLDAQAALGWVADYITTADLPPFDLDAELEKARAGSSAPESALAADAPTATLHTLSPAEA